MRLAIFDLDGTLIDSKQDLTDATNATRVHLGYPPLSDVVVASYIGSGAPVLMRRALGTEASEELVGLALKFFLSYYGEHLLDKTVLYPGVREALDELRGADVPMAVLTNKPMSMSVAIVEGLRLEKHFFRIYGGDSFRLKKPDPVGIEALMNEVHSAREATIMVGDSHIDIKTARNARVRACGVMYGLQPETLAAEPPDLLVDDLRELSRYVITRIGAPPSDRPGSLDEQE
jgi:phosphoglycolate phosphatase